MRCFAECEWLTQAAAVIDAAGHHDDAAAALMARARADGEDVGDHPPITPVKLGTPKQCGDQVGWSLYMLICRHFVATFSDDCELAHARCAVAIGGEEFEATATTCVCRGWTEVLDTAPISDLDGGVFKAIASMRSGDSLPMAKPAASVRSYTQPPPHLSEADLLALMESHGIGTDASMAQHVSNVIRRGYVVLDEQTRAISADLAEMRARSRPISAYLAQASSSPPRSASLSSTRTC